MAKNRDLVYHPSKLFVDQLDGMLEFVTARNVASSDVPVPELTAMLSAQRAQEDQETAEDQRHQTAVDGFARSAADRHARFMQMLGALRAKFRDDKDALAVLDSLKPARDVAKTPQSRAERAKVRAAETRARLDKVMAQAAKLQALVIKQEAEAAKAAEALPPQPTPGSSPNGK